MELARSFIEEKILKSDGFDDDEELEDKFEYFVQKVNENGGFIISGYTVAPLLQDGQEYKGI